ncbi:acyltransferase family protein [Pontibacterium granulatum]|uniref:acyltransferase family protein n=1 Tax=Pontibacterium granulatum TaxID=2036029 RepID=UPI00249A1637|nr:acyltransferase family protein [Pontibacterium granulatum]MDI3323037.1 acyltransferase family protein [Pontibacterium granulatum]
MTLRNPTYRSDIEGLRGIAVISVLLFHAGFDFASGGYIGVDVFFVLSGFLVAESIQNSIQANRFSVTQFYKKRFFRIFPAALTVAALCLLIGLNILFPEELKELSASALSFLLLSANSWASASINYFGIGVEYKPLIHYWSLSIELQFYLISPLIIGLLLKHKREKHLIVLCILVMAISFVYATLQVEENPNKSYFSSIMRAWQFLLGISLSLTLPLINAARVGNQVQSILSSTGILALILSVYIFDNRSNFPGAAALLPCLGTLLILAFYSPGSFAGRTLSSSWLRLFGLISFSLYLVHQPLFAYYRTVLGRPLNDSETLLTLAVSIVAAGILYMLVEKPFQIRSSTPTHKKRLYGVYTLTTLCLALGISYAGNQENLPQFTLSQEVNRYLKYRYENNPRLRECRISNREIDPHNACIYGPSHLPKAALWGDSHADQLAFPLSAAFASHGYSLIEFAIAGCPPILDTKSPSGKRMCSENVRIILDHIAHNKEIEHVVLHAYWTGYIDNHLIYPNKRNPLIDDQETLNSSFERVIRVLLNAGKKVHLIYPVPQMEVNPPLYMARRALTGLGTQEPNIGITQQDFESQSLSAHRFLDNAATNLEVNAVHIADFLFDSKTSTYSATEGPAVLYRDDNHLSITGATKVAKPLASKIFSE